jgi:hypothetical protein
MGQVTPSGTVLLSNVKANFGSTTLYGLRRGTSFTPNYTAYSGISTTAPKIREFLGLWKPPTEWQIINLNDSTGFGAVGVIVTQYANGVCKLQQTAAGITDHFTWLRSGAAANYDLRFTRTSGDSLSSGTVNTWISMSTSPAWSLTAPGGTVVKSTFGHMEIRDSASGTVISNNSITLSIETGT